MTERIGDAASELDTFLDEEVVEWLRNDSLNLILLPVEQCNFRCTYCYEAFTFGCMSPATIQGVKRLIDLRLDDLASLSVAWFGGEPLLARAIVEDISEHIIRVSGDRRPDLRYSADMTTNGYLLDISAVERLAGLGIRLFQVSLDGPEPLHDRTRIRADGKGSFRQIWRNLVAIRDGNVAVNVLLRVHLTPDNLPVLSEFLGEIRDTFLQDKRFQVLLKPVERLGGPNDNKIEVLPRETRSQILCELERVVLNRAIDEHRLYPAQQICYAARPNSLIIRANGDIGKCTVALTNPVNNVGRLLPDGSLEIDNARLRAWLQGWASRDLATLECPLRQASTQLV